MHRFAPFLLMLAVLLTPITALAQSTPPTLTYIVSFYGASSPANVFTIEVKATNLSGVQNELNRLLITADKVVAVIPKR